MRLLNVRTYQLEEFPPSPRRTPPYAVLSHLVDREVISYRDMIRGGSLKSKPGYAKLDFCCKQARKDGLQYCWVYSCCVDDINHAELTEAINAMYRWLANAHKCYAYLSDISDGMNYTQSRWFRLSWALQELIAPARVEFYNREGVYLGDKIELQSELHIITGVPQAVLNLSKRPDEYTVAERMSWASRLRFGRVEDRAYALLGLFGIHMSLLYGEGEGALQRLQKEIMSSTDQISGLRLLNVDTSPLIIETFANEEAPAYAILSHTWDIEEVSYKDVLLGKAPSRKAYAKIKEACKIAAQQGLKYLWVDTCCIDKKSSAELQEAICSMYKWYKNAKVCLVYLQDYVQPSHSEPSLPPWCRWFKRGWTLQELLAPTLVKFFDCKWNELGTKRTLGHQIADITGIDLLVLRGEEDARNRTVAERMSWAAGRETSRVEDVAYSLMGLFDVFMPMLYGEGERAFIRLQEEIMKQSEDNTIFAWKSEDSRSTRGLFARHPSEFGKHVPSSDVTAPSVQQAFSQYWMPDHHHYEPPTLTSRGLLITLPLLSIDSLYIRVSGLSLEARESSFLPSRRRGSFSRSELSAGTYLALICCVNAGESEDRKLLCISVRKHAESGTFTRISPETVTLLPETRASDFQMHTIYALSSKKFGDR